MCRQRNKRGFTVVEVMITVAIIGILGTVALPMMLRVKMNVNMEMVREHLRHFHEAMNDYFNHNTNFPADLTNLGASNEELALTASLFQTDAKAYTIDNYMIFANRSTYQFRSCPKAGNWFLAGDRCYMVDPGGVRMIASMLDPGGLAFSGYQPTATFDYYAYLDLPPDAPVELQVEGLAIWFEKIALDSIYYAMMDQEQGTSMTFAPFCQNCSGDPIPGEFLINNGLGFDFINERMSQVAENLRTTSGIGLMEKDVTGADKTLFIIAYQDHINQLFGLNDPPDLSVYDDVDVKHLGFYMADAPSSTNVDAWNALQAAHQERLLNYEMVRDMFPSCVDGGPGCEGV